MPPGDFQFQGIGHIKQNLEWFMQRPHSHTFHEIILVLQGAMEVHFANGKIRGTAGDVLFYRAGDVHEEFATQPAPLETFYLAFDSSEAITEIPRVTHDTDGRLRVVANWLYQDRDLPDPWASDSLAAHLRMLLLELGRLNLGRQHNLVVQTRQFIRSRIDQTLTLDDLAAHARMSKYHFARRYRELSGRPPAEDIRMMRVEFARNLLLTSDLPLKTIAPMVGLGDVYHLSRMFRKYLNLTPREVRRHGPMRGDEI